MCKFNPKNDSRRIDPCMKELIAFLNEYGLPTVACCCGHSKYPMTIVVDVGNYPAIEICSGIQLNRKKRFYRKDRQGIYYIPEVWRQTVVLNGKLGSMKKEMKELKEKYEEKMKELEFEFTRIKKLRNYYEEQIDTSPKELSK